MSEKHYPYMGGCFDRIIFDGDGTSWVREHTDNETDDLKQCPFCGSTVVGIEKWNTATYVMCNGCDAKVSFEWCNDEDELIRLWNKREVE